MAKWQVSKIFKDGALGCCGHPIISGSFCSFCFVAFLCKCSGEWCLSSRALGRSKAPLEAAVMHEGAVILYMIFAHQAS